MPKTLLLVTLVALVVLCSLSNSSAQTTDWSQYSRPGGRDKRSAFASFKGVELYSWPAPRGWRFRLMWGTNRNKVEEEIVSYDVIEDVDELMHRLSYLAPEESVIWLPMPGTKEMPSDELIERLRALCATLDITFWVSGAP